MDRQLTEADEAFREYSSPDDQQSGDYTRWIVRLGLVMSRGKVTIQMTSSDDPAMVMGNTLVE